MIKQNKHRKTYSKEFKLMAVKTKLEGGNSYKGVVEALEILTVRMLKKWVSSYRAHGEAGLEEHRGKMSTGRPRILPRPQHDEVERRIRRLEMENEVLKKLLELQRRDVPLA